MYLGKVIGRVVASVKDGALEGKKLLLVRRLPNGPAVVAIDAVGHQSASRFVGPVLPVFTILQPRPASEEAVLFGVLIIEAVGQRAITPVVGLGHSDVVIQGFQGGACRGTVGSGKEGRVHAAGRIDAGGERYTRRHADADRKLPDRRHRNRRERLQRRRGHLHLDHHGPQQRRSRCRP